MNQIPRWSGGTRRSAGVLKSTTGRRISYGRRRPTSVHTISTSIRKRPQTRWERKIASTLIAPNLRIIVTPTVPMRYHYHPHDTTSLIRAGTSRDEHSRHTSTIQKVAEPDMHLLALHPRRPGPPRSRQRKSRQRHHLIFRVLLVLAPCQSTKPPMLLRRAPPQAGSHRAHSPTVTPTTAIYPLRMSLTPAAIPTKHTPADRSLTSPQMRTDAKRTTEMRTPLTKAGCTTRTARADQRQLQPQLPEVVIRPIRRPNRLFIPVSIYVSKSFPRKWKYPYTRRVGRPIATLRIHTSCGPKQRI